MDLSFSSLSAQRAIQTHIPLCILHTYICSFLAHTYIRIYVFVFFFELRISNENIYTFLCIAHTYIYIYIHLLHRHTQVSMYWCSCSSSAQRAIQTYIPFGVSHLHIYICMYCTHVNTHLCFRLFLFRVLNEKHKEKRRMEM